MPASVKKIDNEITLGRYCTDVFAYVLFLSAGEQQPTKE